MTTITITLETPPLYERTWGDVLAAVDNCTPVNKDLSVASEWSGDVDAFSGGFKVRVSVRDEPDDEPDTLDTLDALMDAMSDVAEAYTRMRLQESVLSDAEKVGDAEQAAFSRDRIERHKANLAAAQERLESAQEAHRASTRVG